MFNLTRYIIFFSGKAFKYILWCSEFSNQKHSPKRDNILQLHILSFSSLFVASKFSPICKIATTSITLISNIYTSVYMLIIPGNRLLFLTKTAINQSYSRNMHIPLFTYCDTPCYWPKKTYLFFHWNSIHHPVTIGIYRQKKILFVEEFG